MVASIPRAERAGPLSDREIDEPDQALTALPANRESFDREHPVDDLHAAIETTVDAVMDIADNTRPHKPVVRAQSRVGRNDPCPLRQRAQVQAMSRA